MADITSSTSTTTAKLTDKVEAAVTTAVVKPNVEASVNAIPAIMNELIPVIEAIVNSTALQPWYLSKTVWAGVLSLLATLLALVRMMQSKVDGITVRMVGISDTLRPRVDAGQQPGSHGRL